MYIVLIQHARRPQVDQIDLETWNALDNAKTFVQNKANEYWKDVSMQSMPLVWSPVYMSRTHAEFGPYRAIIFEKES